MVNPLLRILRARRICGWAGSASATPDELRGQGGRARGCSKASEHNRLLTLTGPGGSGKTRLGIELASRTLSGLAESVHFVSLAEIRDPSLVPVSIAQGIGLQDARGGRCSST